MGWEKSKFHEVATIFNGNSINAKVKERDYTKQNGIPYIATKDISFNGEVSYDNGVNIPSNKESLFKISKKHSILICAEGGSAGRKIAIIDKDVCFVNKLFSISASKYLLPKYIYFYCLGKHFQDQFKASLHGLIGGVSLSKIKMFDIHYPSLETQARIVSILDSAFADIERARANAEKNLKNARELFDSYLNKVFTEGGDGWVETSLSKECFFSQGIQVGVKHQYKNDSEDRIRFLRIIDFTQGNEESRYIDIPDEKYSVRKDEVSLVRYGASAGFVCTGLTGAIANNLFKVSPKSEAFSNRYLYYFLLSPAFQIPIKSVIGGAAMPALSFKMINEVRFSFPNADNQLIIVNSIEKLIQKTRMLEAICKNKLKSLDELKQSLLQKAFSGELTKEDEGIAA